MTIVRSLICHRDVDTGIVCLNSLSRTSATPVRFVLHDDGSLTDEDTRRLEAVIPEARVLRRIEADERVEALLGRFPLCRDFRRRTPVALKLFDTALLSEGDLAYCDTDVLFLRPFRGLFAWQAATDRFIAMEDFRDSYSVWPWHVLGSGALKLPRRFNAGLMFVRLGQVYDLDFVEWFLGQRQYWCEQIDRLEQTCWAALSRRHDGRKWAVEQVAIVTSDSVLTPTLVAGHFVSGKRHLLAAAVRRLSSMPVEQAVEVRTVEDQPCRPWELGISAARHRLGMARHAALTRLRNRAADGMRARELAGPQKRGAHR